MFSKNIWNEWNSFSWEEFHVVCEKCSLQLETHVKMYLFFGSLLETFPIHMLRELFVKSQERVWGLIQKQLFCHHTIAILISSDLGLISWGLFYRKGGKLTPLKHPLTLHTIIEVKNHKYRLMRAWETDYLKANRKQQVAVFALYEISHIFQEIFGKTTL